MKNISLLISSIFITFCSVAQPEEINNLPRLNNHYFVPHSNTQSPFIKSSFGMNLGIAQSKDFENVILEIGDTTLIGYKGSLIFADLNFDYQQKIKDWISLYMNVAVTARIGTELQSLLSQGVNTVSAFKIGWLFKILENEKNYLSGSIQINSYAANFISISGFVDDIMNDNPNASISKSVPILDANVSLRYAHGFNEKFGVVAFGEIGYGESYTRGESNMIYSLGGLFDMNLATTTKVPLGFALFYNLVSRPELVQVDSNFATNGGLKISYSGAPHFNFGAEISRLRVPIPNVTDKVVATSAFITCIYYFN